MSLARVGAHSVRWPAAREDGGGGVMVWEFGGREVWHNVGGRTGSPQGC